MAERSRRRKPLRGEREDAPRAAKRGEEGVVRFLMTSPIIFALSLASLRGHCRSARGASVPMSFLRTLQRWDQRHGWVAAPCEMQSQRVRPPCR